MKNCLAWILAMMLAIGSVSHAATISLSFSQSGTVGMSINPAGTAIDTLLSFPPNGCSYSSVTGFGMDFYKSGTATLSPSGNATVTQNAASATVNLTSSQFVSGYSARIVAYLIIGGTKYYVNNDKVGYKLNGTALTRNTDGNFNLTLSGGTTPTPTPTPTPTATPTPTPTPTPNPTIPVLEFKLDSRINRMNITWTLPSGHVLGEYLVTNVATTDIGQVGVAGPTGWGLQSSDLFNWGQPVSVGFENDGNHFRGNLFIITRQNPNTPIYFNLGTTAAPKWKVLLDGVNIPLTADGSGGAIIDFTRGPATPLPVISSETQTVTMTVTATGATSYQWLKNGNTISGATTATYTTSDNGTFTCRVYSSAGYVTSRPWIINPRNAARDWTMYH